MPREDTPREEKKKMHLKVFVIYEGHRTEREYFEHFNKKHEKCNFSFKDIEKKSFDRHNTIRMELVEMIKGASIFMSTGNHTPYHFCTVILDKYSELIGLDYELEDSNEKSKRVTEKVMERAQSECLCDSNLVYDINRFIDVAVDEIIPTNKEFNVYEFRKKANGCKKYRNQCSEVLLKELMKLYYQTRGHDKEDIEKEILTRCERLRNIRNAAMDRVDANIAKDDIVVDEEKMLGILMELIVKDVDYEKEYEEDLTSPDLWDVNIRDKVVGDRTFVVFDRDFDLNRKDETRTDDYYRDVFFKCDELGYDVLMSTPAFEIWLLMHHDGVNYSDIRYTDRKILNKKLKMVESINDKDMKSIDSTRFDSYYADSFERALDNSKKHSTDLESLLNNIGSNVGLLLNTLL